jgi:hypothetical protein
MHKYKVGDVVHICNDYGIYLGKHKIIELDERTGKPTYFYENSDTPWFSVHEMYVSQDPEYILELMWDKLTHYRSTGETC